MQHLVVFEVMHERGWDFLWIAGQENCGAGNSCHLFMVQLLFELLRRDGRLLQPLAEDLPPLAPCRHQREAEDADCQRKPTAGRNLDNVCTPEAQVNDQKKAGKEQRHGQRPFPQLTLYDKEQQRGDKHGGRHRYAIGCRQITRSFKGKHQRDTRNHQQPVDARDIDLSAFFRRCMLDRQAGQIAQLDGLHGERKSTRDQGL